MQLVQVGVSHHSAPIDVREQLSCSAHALPDALSALIACDGIREAALLSTCNRMEVYVVADGSDPEPVYATISRHLARFHAVTESRFASLLDLRSSPDAVSHLFRVASGLDSLVLGESQILGQVRHAIRASQTQRAAGKVLSRLFEQAVATGKRAQTETGLGRGGFSVGHAAVDLASRIFDNFSQAQVLILGAGKMSEVTARHLVRSGVKFVMVANRTHVRAVALAERLGGRAIDYDEAFASGLAQADIVIASTAAPHPILRRETLQPLLRKRRGRPLFLIDIALPRDIDPDVNELDNVFLYNIDDLQNYVRDDALGRADEAGRAETVVAEETARFMAWYHTLEAAPVITEVHDHLEQIRQQYMAIFAPRLAHLSEKDRKTLELLTRSMMEQVARQPILQLKRAAAEAGNEAAEDDAQLNLLAAARRLFGLSELTEPDPSVAPNEAENAEMTRVEAG